VFILVRAVYTGGYRIARIACKLQRADRKLQTIQPYNKIPRLDAARRRSFRVRESDVENVPFFRFIDVIR